MSNESGSLQLAAIIRSDFQLASADWQFANWLALMPKLGNQDTLLAAD